jgi:hypothetical protein
MCHCDGRKRQGFSGNALMLKACGVEQPFLNAKHFQKFKFNSKRQIQLCGSHLCIAAGTESHTTYSPVHRWRSLLMLPCAEADLTYSVWQFVPAGNLR